MHSNARNATPSTINYRLPINICAITTTVAACLLAGSAASSLAGYTVKTAVETVAGTTRFTWTVHNQDQSWGLDQFVIQIPAGVHVLAFTVPPPYSNPDGTAYWIMEEHYDAQVDPHDNRAWLPASPAGKRWLVWSGEQSPSVYPPGTTATFSVTTDSRVEPGAVPGVATTYTPQHNPHYYFAWQGEVTGPRTLARNAPPGTHTNLQTYSVFATNLYDELAGSQASPAVPAATVSITLHAAVAIQGEVGLTYEIQCTDDLRNTHGWQPLAHITLSSPSQVWYDPEPALQGQRYYRILPATVP